MKYWVPGSVLANSVVESKIIVSESSPCEILSLGLLLQVTDFTDTVKVIKWNKKLLNCFGLWPLKVRDSIFLPCFTYGCVFSLLGFLDMFDYISDFDYTITNIMENLQMLMALVKMSSCRLHRKSISRFLTETRADYHIDNYTNDEEKSIFLKYNKLSYKFVTVAFPSVTTIYLLYYFKTVISSVFMVMANSSTEYELPYKIRPLIKPTDWTSYAFCCAFELIAIPVVMSGYAGTDCLLTWSGFHLTAQLAILKSRVKEALKGTNGSSQRGIRKLVIQHHRLISLTDTLEDSFNIVICQQLLGTIFQLCMSGYHTLLNLAEAKGVRVILFAIHACTVSSTLFVHCYIGECLIEESTSLCEAFYYCDWYKLSPKDLKSIHICMIRTRKPLQLTSAKFCAVSLCTFSNILRTSMAYLSVLRSFL